jgi:hypothetical protein
MNMQDSCARFAAGDRVRLLEDRARSKKAPQRPMRLRRASFSGM